MPAFLIPILLKYVLPAGILLCLVGFAGYKVHQDGRAVERAIWQEKALKVAQENEASLLAAHKLAAMQRAQHEKQLQEVTDVKREKINALERDITRLSRSGLYIPTSACPDSGTGETQDPSGTGGTSGRIRLPSEIEEDLISLAYDAQRVVVQYEGCRMELKNLVDVLPEVD